MPTRLITNDGTSTIADSLNEIAEKSHGVTAIVAFVTDESLFLDWIARDLDVRLLVRLRYPTAPIALRRLLSAGHRIEVYYRKGKVHEKSFVFYQHGQPRVAVVGSANFTEPALGLKQPKNVEACVVTDDKSLVTELRKHHAFCFENPPLPPLLTADEVEVYESEYNRYSQANNKVRQKQSGQRDSERANKRLRLKAPIKRWLTFCNQVKSLKPVLEPLMRTHKQYKDVPFFLIFNSFFHYLHLEYNNTSTYKKPKRMHVPDQREARVKKIFNDFLDKNWEGKDLLVRMRKAKRLTGKRKIQKWTKQDANEFYWVFDAAGLQTQWFGLDVMTDFNDLRRLRKSVGYLLHGRDPVQVRIQRLMYDDYYKLEKGGPAFVQEALGWAFPDRYPPRNGKSIKGMRFLGFDLSDAD